MDAHFNGVDSIVGLMWGSEGKGKIVSSLASYYDAAVRTGAPNAGHTTVVNGSKYVMRSVPCAWSNLRCKLFIGPGGMINIEVLQKELAQFPINAGVLERLHFDRNAIFVDEHDIAEEERNNMNAKNGSTAEGVGVAQARKILRRSCHTVGQIVNSEEPQVSRGDQLADDIFVGRVGDVAMELNAIFDAGGSIMLEGTQGFGLCMNHGDYPFVTSRDVLPSSLMSDAGLAPSLARFTFGVMRTYPIRVAGNSGPMGNAKEIDWAEVSRRCGAPDGAIVEKTTVTKRVRRVSEIDWQFMKRSVALNRPDGIFITFIDYIDWSMHGKTEYRDLTVNAIKFIGEVEGQLGVPVVGISTGPGAEEMIYTPAWDQFKAVLADNQLALA